MPYRLSDFDYELPPELIAVTPAAERSASRLLHVSRSGLRDLRFRQLATLLEPGDLVVLNDTRVIKSRLFGQKPSGGRVELLLERILGAHEAIFQLRASHPPRAGGVVLLPGGVQAMVTKRDGRFVRLHFEQAGSLLDYLQQHGEVPLPRYIERAPDAGDETRYQTVYAREPGAVAAPTAGLHFDSGVLEAIAQRGIGLAYVTLHVGAGTFAPVESEDLSRHCMHSEWYRVPQQTAHAIHATRQRGGRVVAIGTTTLRALESAAGEDATAGLGDSATVTAREGETTLFITPGFRFRIVDRLVTNFHLPRSTLLMLVSAFAGYDLIRSAYAHATCERYRFYSYGDAMLLERDDAPERSSDHAL